MTTLIVSAASGVGGAVGGAFFGPVGEAIGQFGGRYLGRALSNHLTAKPTKYRTVYGNQLSDLNVQASNEGGTIPRVYGRARVSGQVIWATQFEEVVNNSVTSTRPRSGGKATARPAATQTTNITYSYFANFAVALCEGEISHIARVWADGKLLDTNSITMRVYKGSETQNVDPLILAKQGADLAPAYNGVAYVVFEHLGLEKFGNRLPQLQFEVIRVVGDLEPKIQAMTIIPGATEFGYDSMPIVRVLGIGKSVAENNHAAHAPTNFEASLEELLAICPNVQTVSLVVPWFGNDLRAGNCTIKPKVENAIKQVSGVPDWAVAGLTRGTADVVSQSGGVGAYGGTPSDASVVRCIQFLKARGLKVVMYPFVLMDIPVGNGLPDPYGASEQSAYPWRGRITCSPAIGVAGTVDNSAAADTQINAFFGTVGAGWNYAGFINHLANICGNAGGVDGFIIGSEMIGITRARGSTGNFPAVAKLKTIAANARSILGAGVKLTYAADWTEYGTYVVGGNVYFPLDDVWSDININAVGIDFYAPITDWRDGFDHLDALEFGYSTHPDYLKNGFKSGEGYDWYYANEAARTQQLRTPITDSAYNKPWMYRQKDLKSWWSNAHFERVAGVQNGTATSWVAQSKPIWCIEIGFPAVDSGTNEPSAFPDGKSVEGKLPRFSYGMRDDHSQRRGLEAFYAFYEDVSNNPNSTVYSGKMMPLEWAFPWAWDARPFPFFPALSDVWADGENWHTGHWLNGRLGGLPLDGLVKAVMSDCDINEDLSLDVQKLTGCADGLVIDDQKSAADILESVGDLQQFYMVEIADGFKYCSRGIGNVLAVNAGEFVLIKGKSSAKFVVEDSVGIADSVSLVSVDALQEYRRVAVTARRDGGTSAVLGKALHTQTGIVMAQDYAEYLATRHAWSLWSERKKFSCSLPLSFIGLEVGDVILLEENEQSTRYEIEALRVSKSIKIDAVRLDAAVYVPRKRVRARALATPLVRGGGTAAIMCVEVPSELKNGGILNASTSNATQRITIAIAAFAQPWQRQAVYRMIGDDAVFMGFIDAPATMGILENILNAGGLWRRDAGIGCNIGLYGGELESVSTQKLLNGANAMLLSDAGRGVEIVQFQNAELIGTERYTLSNMLRGQVGTDAETAIAWGAGTRTLMLDSTLLMVELDNDALDGEVNFKIGPASLPYNAAEYVTHSIDVTGRYLRPLAPVLVEAQRVTSGIAVQFKRRQRINSDSWNVSEIPLNEAENYTLEVMSGVIVKRAVALRAPEWLYANVDEITDFGAVQSSLNVRVRHNSAVFGASENVQVVVSV